MNRDTYGWSIIEPIGEVKTFDGIIETGMYCVIAYLFPIEGQWLALR